ncbi:hypothetical protein [Paenibacillus luteus]|uniref:hypothetical protein n=1 Tax=Paenibacillus luteus TaxID=2545753 RepID=UPI001142A5C9|nr:hypothetical protein [Paenibacillus luteus]
MNRYQEFLLITEEFIKREVDLATARSLSDEAFGRFIEKMVIVLSRQTFPKRTYNLNKNSVRQIFTDVLFDITQTKSLSLNEKNAYSYITTFKEYRLVFAKTKKEAREIISKLPLMTMSAIGRWDSLQKVSAIFKSHVVTEKGEKRKWDDPWLHTINLYGNGGNLND